MVELEADEFRALTVDPLTVTLAVEVVDGRTGGPLTEPPSVSVDGQEQAYRAKTATLLLFVDVPLPDTPVPVEVTTEGGYRALEQTVLVTTSPPDTLPRSVLVRPPSNPSVRFTLFPEDTTVLRGLLRTTDGEPLVGETISRATQTTFESTTTDGEGRFILDPAGITGTTSIELSVSTPYQDAPLSVSHALTGEAVNYVTFEVTPPDDQGTSLDISSMTGIQ